MTTRQSHQNDAIRAANAALFAFGRMLASLSRGDYAAARAQQWSADYFADSSHVAILRARRARGPWIRFKRTAAGTYVPSGWNVPPESVSTPGV